MNSAAELRSRLEAAMKNRIPRALTPMQRPTPERVPTGIASVDTFTGGIPVGCLSELCGSSSSGRTSVLLALMAECMRRNEICALVDASDAFDPQSAANAGVDLARLLWIRCSQKSSHRVIGLSDAVQLRSHHNRSGQLTNPKLTSSDYPITRAANRDSQSCGERELEQALKTTDLLLQAGGFGLVALDLGDISIPAARRIPLTTWFRFRRAVENTATAFLILEQQPHAKSCASLVLDFTAQQASWSEAAQPAEQMVDTHSDGSISPDQKSSTIFGAPLEGVTFRVTAQGIAIPFDKPSTSSYEMPQRWITPRARLLNTLHVHLQVTRSRMTQSQKLLVRAFTPSNSSIQYREMEPRSKAM